MKKLMNTFRSSSVDPLDLIESADASMMCMTLDEVKNQLEKLIVSMHVETKSDSKTSEDEGDDISFNYDVIGKDVPRLVGKTFVNGVKMLNVPHFIVSLIDLVLNRGIPTELLQSSGDTCAVDVHEYYNNLYAQLSAVMKQNNTLDDNVSLTSYLKSLFMVHNPVFQLLRSYNQNAISQPVTYYKLILQTVHKLQFQDKDWNVYWDITDHDMYGKKRTISVTHVRTEKYLADRQHKFSFSWNIKFEYEQVVKSVEEYNRSPVSNLELIAQKDYTPARLVQVTMSFGNIDEWIENVPCDHPSFSSKESAIAFLEYIFESTSIKF